MNKEADYITDRIADLLECSAVEAAALVAQDGPFRVE